MNRWVTGAIVVAVVVTVLVLLWLGWRARRRRQGSLRMHDAAAVRGVALTEPVSILYVATTLAGDPLDRVAVGGLGFRAAASLELRGGGLWLHIPGETDVFVPARSLRGWGEATWTIDRAVEPGGLVLLRWITADGTEVDTYLRVIDPADRDRVAVALDVMHPSPPRTTPPSEELEDDRD